MKNGNIIYLNQIKLCEDVERFKVIVDKAQKESVFVEVNISGKDFTAQYVLN